MFSYNLIRDCKQVISLKNKQIHAAIYYYGVKNGKLSRDAGCKLAGTGNTCVNHKLVVAPVHGDPTSAIAPKAEQPGGSWVVPAKSGRSPASWGGNPAVPRLQLHKQTSETLHWGKIRRGRTSGTNRHRCSTGSTRSSEGVRDNWCPAASLSSPCTCGWGPRLAAYKTAPLTFPWLVPVFDKDPIVRTGCRRTACLPLATVTSIHVVPRHRCPAGTHSNLEQREFDSLAETRKPAPYSHPWLMWRCSREERGPLWHTNSWLGEQDVFMDQRCKYLTAFSPSMCLSYSLV